MSSAPTPALAPQPGVTCVRCQGGVPAGHRVWSLPVVEEHGPVTAWWCLSCARPLVSGEAGQSAAAMSATPLPVAQPRVAGQGARPDSGPFKLALALTFLATVLQVGVAPSVALQALFGLLAGLGAVASVALAVPLLVHAVSGAPRARTPRSCRPDSWAKGARGEQVVAAALARTGLTALHDRTRPGLSSNIDHLVVGPAAVYVVDAKNYNSGPLWAGRTTLRIGNWDQTALLHGVRGQVKHVQTELRRAAIEVPVVPVLCFTGTSAPLGQVSVADVVLCNPTSLHKVVSAPGPLRDRGEAAALADVLAWTFPPT